MKKERWTRFKKAWNVFFNKDPTGGFAQQEYGWGSSYQPDRIRMYGGSERTIVSAIYSRMSIDVSSMNIRHVRVDDNDRFVDNIDSKLNERLSLSANIDQTGRALIQDIALTMLEYGVAAVVPVDTDNEFQNGIHPDEINELRVGQVKEWFPTYVKLEMYNELNGQRQEITLPKESIAIISNPFYLVMNEPNSTLQRLKRKLSLLDMIDNQSGSQKLDMLIQLPYTLRSELNQQHAEKRRKEIEQQMANSKFGIGFIDATEHVTQLNRAVENNLMPQIEYLTNMVYGQLGVTPEILNGTANEQVMKNYLERTIKPITDAITEELQRKFLSKTAMSRNQSILAFNDPFRMVPTSQIAEMADKLTRNEIMTSNEIRKIFGIKPSTDPSADELRNKNLNQSANKSDQQTPLALDFNENPDDESLLSEGEYQQAISDLDYLDDQLYDISREIDRKEKDEIKHEARGGPYASKYYDPVKAHEYYEKTKELKGRRSTSTLNEEGKSAAKYVKEQLDNEKKERIKAETDRVNNKINSLNSKISQERKASQNQIIAYSNNIQRRIDILNSRLKRSGASETYKEQIRSEISSLREDNQRQRDKINLMYKTTVEELRSSNKSEIKSLREELASFKSGLKSEYDEKYLNELDNLKKDPSLSKEAANEQNASGPEKLSAEERKARREAIDARNAGKITDEEMDKRFEEAKRKYRK